MSEGEQQGAIAFRDVLDEVIQAAKVPARRRGASIKPTVETLASECYERGVLPDALKDLIDLIITPSHLDQASLNSLVRNLYPATPVDGDIVIKVVGCLGHGALKPSLAIQSALLRWLIMIHHIMEKHDVLQTAYSVLFNLLDTAAIRPQLCHLLALITRRKHVRPYRIQSVLALSAQTASDPALIGLLRIFKDYYPEIIVGDATRGKASTFKHPDLEWRKRLDDIQQAHAQTLDERGRPQDAFRVTRRAGHTVGAGKAASIIPEVHTSHAQENSVTLEEIANVDELVQGLETIELPNQLISVLADPLLQKLMLLRPDPVSYQRISNWVAAYADDILNGESDGGTDLAGFLGVLQQYVSATKTIPPIVLSFLSAYAKVWDGRVCKKSMLQILSYAALPEGSFAGLYRQVYEPVESKVCNGSADSQLDMLNCYTALLQHWTSILLAREGRSTGRTTAVSDLVTHVNKLCLTVLQTSSGVSTHSLVLDFYETVARCASNPKLNRNSRIVIPPATLVYILHFSASPVTISRLCGLLALYKDGFQQAMAVSRSDYTAEYINGFNGFLMDICNCLWRSRAFNTKDPNAHGCLIPEDIAGEFAGYITSLKMSTSVTALFTLSASPALGSLATAYLRELEELEMEQGTGELDTRHAGPVSKASLAALARNGGVSLSWNEYRQGVLSHLEQQGMDGVGRLMHNTMTTLMNKT